LIDELSLYQPIFYISPANSSTFSTAPADSKQSLIAAIILHVITESTSSTLSPLHPTLKTAFASQPSIKPRLYLASALTPYKNLTYTDHKKKIHPVTELVLREGVKLGAQNHYLDGIPTLFAAAEILKNPSLEEKRFASPSERVAIGFFLLFFNYLILKLAEGLVLRDRLVHNPNVGSTWQISLLFSLVQELIPLWSSEDTYDGTALLRLSVLELKNLAGEGASECIETYNHFVSHVEELGLSGAGDMKPILNASELCLILGANFTFPYLGQRSGPNSFSQTGALDGTSTGASHRVATRAPTGHERSLLRLARF
jgi:tRNA nucleotidyltransferase (CCA-adding enzyme)